MSDENNEETVGLTVYFDENRNNEIQINISDDHWNDITLSLAEARRLKVKLDEALIKIGEAAS